VLEANQIAMDLGSIGSHPNNQGTIKTLKVKTNLPFVWFLPERIASAFYPKRSNPNRLKVFASSVGFCECPLSLLLILTFKVSGKLAIWGR